MLAAVDSGADQRNPRIRTAGSASSAWPIKSEAAAAISSAKPMMVNSSLRPNRSGCPRRSISAGRPAAPIATPAVPWRQGRPKLSFMTTAISIPVSAASPRRSACALRSGFSGNSSTRWEPSGGPTFDWSTPAFAMMKPSLCSTISTPRRARTTRTDSDRTTSTSRGSLPTSAASATARAEGSIVARSTRRPSAFETIFCATTSTSPARGSDAVQPEGRRNQFGQVIAGPDQGQTRQGNDLQRSHAPLEVSAGAPKRRRRRGRTCSA